VRAFAISLVLFTICNYCLSSELPSYVGSIEHRCESFAKLIRCYTENRITTCHKSVSVSPDSSDRSEFGVLCWDFNTFVAIIFGYGAVPKILVTLNKQSFDVIESMFPVGTKIAYLFQQALYFNLEPHLFSSLTKEFLVGTCDYSVDPDYGRMVYSFMKKNNQWNVHVNQCLKDGHLNYTSLLHIQNITTFNAFPDSLLFVKGCGFCYPGVWHDLLHGINHYQVNSKSIFFDLPTKIKCSSSAKPFKVDYDSFFVPISAKCNESKVYLTSRVLSSSSGTLEFKNPISFKHNAESSDTFLTLLKSSEES